MAFVLDASCMLALALKETALNRPAFMDLLASEEALVPPIWHYEVGNGLVLAVRRKRTTREIYTAFLAELDDVTVVVDHASQNAVWTVTLDLAERYGLTVYDASYLELALRTELPIATLDAALIKASRKSGVEVLPV